MAAMRPFSSKTPYVFDNDCLASFLWVQRIDILKSLFGENILIPSVVKDEFKKLKRTRYGWVYQLLETEISNGIFQQCHLPAVGEIAEEFKRLINGTYGKIMGKGEAAVMAWVRYNGGTVASNNLSDVAMYCRKYSLDLISTDDILCKACHEGIISQNEGECIWAEMKRKRRVLPDYSFSEALHRFLTNAPK
ncbi:hypothetical protein MOTE_10220 [Moorella thermoacetica]|uniref:PIN domain-containing protein n=1 Tax=Neomoorella thermoacetica TaxID=1525 RepID=A0A1J5NMD4_NEOTH|nr:hypothetical protein MOTE_10220 [Moorella thermoacetica]